MDFLSAKSKGKPKIIFVSKHDFCAVEVAQIPQNEVYHSSTSQHNLHQSKIPVINKTDVFSDCDIVTKIKTGRTKML